MTTPPEPGSETPYQRADFIKGAGVALLAAAVVFIAVVGLFTLFGVSNNQHAQTVTLNATNANTVATKRIADGLAKGDATVARILIEAGQAVIALEASQKRLEANEYAVCVAVHASGCVSP